MDNIKIEHIDALSKGKKSGIGIGSRGIAHNLYQYERDEFERALKRKYITVDVASRPNLQNLWTLVCDAKNWTELVLRKNGNTGEVLQSGNIIFSGDVYQAKIFIKTDEASRVCSVDRGTPL